MHVIHLGSGRGWACCSRKPAFYVVGNGDQTVFLRVGFASHLPLHHPVPFGFTSLNCVLGLTRSRAFHLSVITSLHDGGGWKRHLKCFWFAAGPCHGQECPELFVGEAGLWDPHAELGGSDGGPHPPQRDHRQQRKRTSASWFLPRLLTLMLGSVAPGLTNKIVIFNYLYIFCCFECTLAQHGWVANNGFKNHALVHHGQNPPLMWLVLCVPSQSVSSPLQSLQQRTWLIHWSLFVFFNHPKGRDNIIELFLYQPQ